MSIKWEQIRECRGPEPTILPVPTTAAAESVLLCQPTIRHILSRDQAANRQHLALETTSCWRLCFGPVSSGFWPIKCIQFACKIKSDKKRVTIENASKQQPPVRRPQIPGHCLRHWSKVPDIDMRADTMV